MLVQMTRYCRENVRTIMQDYHMQLARSVLQGSCIAFAQWSLLQSDDADITEWLQLAVDLWVLLQSVHR